MRYEPYAIISATNVVKMSLVERIAAADPPATSYRITLTMSGMSVTATRTASIVALRRHVLGIITPYDTIHHNEMPSLYAPWLCAKPSGKSASHRGKSAERNRRRARSCASRSACEFEPRDGPEAKRKRLGSAALRRPDRAVMRARGE